jgi:hypothetical protein
MVHNHGPGQFQSFNVSVKSASVKWSLFHLWETWAIIENFRDVSH